MLVRYTRTRRLARVELRKRGIASNGPLLEGQPRGSCGVSLPSDLNTTSPSASAAWDTISSSPTRRDGDVELIAVSKIRTAGSFLMVVQVKALRYAYLIFGVGYASSP